MKLRSMIYTLLLGMVLLLSSGSACEEGLRAGLVTGTTEAINALLTVPLNYYLEQKYPPG